MLADRQTDTQTDRYADRHTHHNTFAIAPAGEVTRLYRFSEYKHSLTFRVRAYVVIATKPVH